MASCCAISSSVSAAREWTACLPDDDEDWESTMAECSLGLSCPCSKALLTGLMVPERLRVRMETPGVAEFSGSSAGCLPVSLSTMLTNTSMNSSSDGISSSLKWSHLVSSADLVAERHSNTDLVCVGDEPVQSASTDATILSHLSG